MSTMIDNNAVSYRPATQLRNRTDAGHRLASLVTKLSPARPVVLALPRGGVPVAVPVAQALNGPLDVLVVRKLGLPTNPEYAFGAMGEDGKPLVDDRIVAAADLRADEVADVITREQRELTRRIGAYRQRRPAQDLTDTTAVIVDDGAATGSTALAAIAVARSLGAATVIAAMGVAPPDVLDLLGRHADYAVAAMTPEPFMSVGQWYGDFSQVSDDQVLAAFAD